MYNLFKVFPADWGPNTEQFIGTVATLDEALTFEKNYEKENPRPSSWEPYIVIKEVKLMKI